MDAYVSKPFRPEELFVTVEQLAGGGKPIQPPTVDEEDEEPPGVVFDKERALEEFGNDLEFLAEIAGIFVREAAELVAEGDRALDAGDPDTLAKVAHRLKGACGQITAEEAQQAAYRVETAGKAGETNGLAELWGAFKDAYERLRPVVAELAPDSDDVG
jgi:HPt (histidine-containing phosphotransfer) domain-containing protein